MTEAEMMQKIMDPANWTDSFFTEIQPVYRQHRDVVREKLIQAGLWESFDDKRFRSAFPNLAALINGEQIPRTAQAAKEQGMARADYLINNAAAHLKEFMDDIAASVDTPVISTGFKHLDEALDGGLYEGLYCIGALSSNGKTTFCLQMADAIAAAGHDVVIVSLEMARAELMAKSISRHTLLDVLANRRNMQNAKTARGITAGRRYAQYSQEELRLIQRAVAAYGKYAGHIYIHESIGEIGAVQVRELVRQHVDYTGNTPVVLVDYLQILQPYDLRATDKANTDKAVLELKRISRDYKTPVIAISSFNRMNYSEEVNMSAFKESGAIEYSSDVLLGMQLTGAGAKNFNTKEAKQKNPRDIEIVILKQRNGHTGDTIQFQYYPMFNYFKEVTN